MYATTLTCANALNIKTVYALSDNVFATTDSSYILNERKIMTDILRDYESAVRPVMQDADAVPVRFDLSIISVESLVRARTHLLVLEYLLKNNVLYKCKTVKCFLQDAASQVLAVHSWIHMVSASSIDDGELQTRNNNLL
jgi:hypothetical protein